MAERDFMARALELAELGRGRTSPNPVVGAVIVKDGRIVGEGYHERCGEAHAEVNALRQAGDLASGAAMFVTLEPCCVWGKTPPCTDAIVAAGVARVVVAHRDPNPDVSGRGIAELARRGVSVEEGLLSHEAAAANEPYLKFRATGLPLVTLKLATSLDGRVTAPGGARWITCEQSRAMVHAMRGASDCVAVGVGTVLADDPLLTDRRPRAARQPARLVTDSGLRTPPSSRLAASARAARTIVACSDAAPAAGRRGLEELGVEVWAFGRGDGGIDLAALLRRVAAEGMTAVLCEGGPTLASALVRGGLVDRVAFFVAPSLAGGGEAAALGDLGRDWTDGALRLGDARWSTVGSDALLEARVQRAGRP
jgi:diaminohydroxyphosphoribosylaminopyrimidine deaminase/5-amino-6-(5-phosphoribosylamino)uracil reductase